MKLIFEKSVPGRRCSILPRCDVEEVQLPQELRRQEPRPCRSSARWI